MIDRPAEDAVTPVGPVRWDVAVNYHACEGKQTCIEVCPTDVFLLQKTRVKHPLFRLKIIVHGGMQAVPVNEEACIGCMECVTACQRLPSRSRRRKRTARMTQGYDRGDGDQAFLRGRDQGGKA